MNSFESDSFESEIAAIAHSACLNSGVYPKDQQYDDCFSEAQLFCCESPKGNQRAWYIAGARHKIFAFLKRSTSDERNFSRAIEAAHKIESHSTDVGGELDSLLKNIRDELPENMFLVFILTCYTDLDERRCALTLNVSPRYYRYMKRQMCINVSNLIQTKYRSLLNQP